MDYNEKDIIKKINKEFRAEAAKTELPRSLRTENIVAMLKENQKNEKSNIVSLNDISQKRKQTERAISAVKGFISVAAALVLVVMTALLYNARKEISVLTEKNNLAGNEMSPEKIEYHIISEVKNKTSKSKSSGSADSENKPGDSKGENDSPDDTKNNPEPTTLTAEQSVPVTGAVSVMPDTEFAVSDGNCIYRCIGVNSEYFVDIISMSTLERVVDNPIKLGGRCDELSIQNNILAAVYKNSNGGVLVKFYDVSNKTQPVLAREYYQKGSYEFLSFSGGKICLVTKTNGSPPDFTVNGKTGGVDDSIEINTGSPYYTLISVTDADNLNSDFVRAKVHGELENISFKHSGIVASCSSVDAETGVSFGNVCRFALDGSGLSLVEKNTLPGKVAKMGVMNDGTAAAVITDRGSSDLVLLRPGEGEFASAEDFYPGEVKKIYCLDNRIAVTGASGMYTVKYNNSGDITVTETAEAFNSKCKIFESDTLLISESAPDSKGKTAWTVASRSGIIFTFSLDSKSITSDPSRKMLVSGSGVCAVPVMINGTSGYLFFAVDSSGSFSAYPTPYLLNGTGKEIFLISGDNFYMVSSSRVTAVSVSEIFKK